MSALIPCVPRKMASSRPNRRSAFPIRLGPALVFAAVALLAGSPAHALVIFGGDGTNQTSDPGGGLPWGNAGRVGVGGGIFLGNLASGSWVLTATHLLDGAVVSANGAPGITLGGHFYAGMAGSGVRVLNSDSSPTDLYLYRITSGPSLPTVTLASARPALGTDLRAIGFGGVEATLKRWTVTINDGASNDVWNETADVAASNYVGYTVTGGGTPRWGATLYRGNANTFDIGTGLTQAITTSFDSITGSALGVSGDSGGPLFTFEGSQWVLSGIFGALATLSVPDTAPPGGAVATGKVLNTLYHLNLSSDIVAYRDFITTATAIPEPSAWAGLAGAAALIAAFTRRRRAPLS